MKAWIKCTHSENTHKNMDRLSGVPANSRNPSDRIDIQIFSFLKCRFGQCEEIRKYADKYVAHSTSHPSRAKIKYPKITLKKLHEAQQILCETAQFIGQEILNQPFGNFLPTAQYNPFKNLDKPWINEDSVLALSEGWSKYEKQIISWSQWNWQPDYARFISKS